MTSPLSAQGHGNLVMDERRLGELGDELGQRPVDGCEQLEQLREARDGVVARQELREDVAAADGSREDHPSLRCGACELGEGRRGPHDLKLRVLDEPFDLARHGHGERELSVPPVRAEEAEEQQQRLLDGHLARLLVDEVQPFGGTVEDRAEIRPDHGHEPLRLADRGRESGRSVRVLGPLPGECVGGDDLDSERAEHERQHVRRAGEAVIDDDPELPGTHRFGVDRRKQLGGVRLAHPRGIRDSSHLARSDAAELAAREVLLDLLLHRGAHLDSRRVEELDPDHLGVVRADADVEARVVCLRFHEMSRDGRGADAEILDVNAGGRDPGDHRALDHPAGGGALAAGDDARAPLQRGAERGGETDGHVRRQVDVHHPGHAVLAEDAGRAARLPDQALVELRAGLDLLERIDADAREDHAFGADRHLVADRDALVDAHVRAEVAAAADDCAHDLGAAADVRRGVDDRTDDATALSDGDARREHRVRPDVAPRPTRQ